MVKDIADLLYDDVPDVISKLTRTALVAAEGCSLVVSDFAAIEARVVAWLAGGRLGIRRVQYSWENI